MTYFDLAFGVTATKPIPVDHGDALYGAISRLVPQAHCENGIAVHPIRGQQVGDRLLSLMPWSSLTIRVPDGDVGQVHARPHRHCGATLRVAIPDAERRATFGLVLCKPADHAQVRLARTAAARKIGVATYQTILPEEHLLEQRLARLPMPQEVEPRRPIVAKPQLWPVSRPSHFIPTEGLPRKHEVLRSTRGSGWFGQETSHNSHSENVTSENIVHRRLLFGSNDVGIAASASERSSVVRRSASRIATRSVAPQ